MKQVCEAVNEIHSLRIIHRDIKPENILVDVHQEPIVASIIDYGCSATIDNPEMRPWLTKGYSPPESYSRGPKTQALDVFSIARTIALLWGISRANYDVDDWVIAKHIASHVNLETLFTGLYGLSATNKQDIKSTLQAMVRADSRTRIPLEEAIAAFAKIKLEPLFGRSVVPSVDPFHPLFITPPPPTKPDTSIRVDVYPLHKKAVLPFNPNAFFNPDRKRKGGSLDTALASEKRLTWE